MHPDAADVGDRLRHVIAQVAFALMQGDVEQALAAISSAEASDACSAWDRLRGRYASSEEELERGRQQLLAMLGEQEPSTDAV